MSETGPSGWCKDCLLGWRGSAGNSDAWSEGWSGERKEKGGWTCSGGNNNPPDINMGSITWPCWSNVLFVSFILRKENDCFIQWLPGAGESGCMYSRHGGWGSAFPATSHCSFFHYRDIVRWDNRLASVRAPDMFNLASVQFEIHFPGGNEKKTYFVHLNCYKMTLFMFV